MLRAQYLENNWRCYLATIANYYLVSCEAVWSAILATAWLLVLSDVCNATQCHETPHHMHHNVSRHALHSYEAAKV